MTTTQATASTGATRTLAELQSSRRPSASLGKDAFLQLLVMQMSNQNPLEPTSDTEYIAQLAQFSMLEQLQSMSATAATSQAYGLIGKYVYLTDDTHPDGGQLLFGRVDGVLKREGKDYLVVGNRQYPLSQVTGVVNSLADEGLDEQVLNSANLIGKTITASLPDEEGTRSVTGQVTRIVIQDASIWAVVGEDKVPLGAITQIEA